MDGKVLNKETKKLIVDAIDDAVKLPFFLEWADGAAAKFLIDYLDKLADKYIDDSVDVLINTGIKKAFDGNADDASKNLGSALNILINIPYLEEDTEQGIFVDGMKFILRFLINWVHKK